MGFWRIPEIRHAMNPRRAFIDRQRPLLPCAPKGVRQNFGKTSSGQTLSLMVPDFCLQGNTGERHKAQRHESGGNEHAA